MPRYPCVGACACANRSTVTIPVRNAATGQPLGSPLVFPAVIAGLEARCENLTQFLATLRASFPDGMTLTVAANGHSLIVGYFPGLHTPPASVDVWPTTTVQVLRSTGGAHCPFVGPVTWNGATYQTLDALLAGASTPTVKYWPGTGAGCPVVAAYRPGTPLPGNLTVAPAATLTSMPLLDDRAQPVACPPTLPVWLAADNTRHATLASLAGRVQSILGAGYSVQPAADGCSLQAQHSSFLAAPGPVVVFPSSATTIPVTVGGLPVCPVPFPVRLTANGPTYSDLAALATAWVADKGARWEAAPFGACNVRVTFPLGQAAPTTLPVIVPAPVSSGWTFARSRAGGDTAALTEALWPSDPENAALLLVAERAWPAPPLPTGSRSAQLVGLRNATTTSFWLRRVVVTLYAPGAKIGLWDRAAFPNAGHPLIAPYLVSGGTVASNVITAGNGTVTITWRASTVSDFGALTLIIAGLAQGTQAAVMSTRLE